MLLSKIFILIILIITGYNMPKLSNINDYFVYSNSITIYNNGQVVTFEQDTEQYETIMSAINTICQDSHEMPAFGVSLHNDTIIAIQSGIWLELSFDKEYTHNDMPFSKLLIEVNPDYSGFNIIRYHNNVYDGRCFYINLNNNMSTLYSRITSSITN